MAVRAQLASLGKNLAKRASDGSGVPRYFIRQVMFETRMTAIRLYGLNPLRRWKIRKLEKNASLRLIFGCGLTQYPGWIGIDCFRGSTVDLCLDLRRRLPFRDQTVEYCYSEHFVEHLYPEEAQRHLREVYRILKPGGVYRMVVPAGMRFAQKYMEGDKDFFTLAHPWEERPFDALYKILSWADTHRSFYDFAQVQYLAGRAGFSQVRECCANKSSIPELRIDRGEPQRVAESLYTEMVKS